MQSVSSALLKALLSAPLVTKQRPPASTPGTRLELSQAEHQNFLVLFTLIMTRFCQEIKNQINHHLLNEFLWQITNLVKVIYI